jgi:hypothetical protein
MLYLLVMQPTMMSYITGIPFLEGFFFFFLKEIKQEKFLKYRHRKFLNFEMFFMDAFRFLFLSYGCLPCYE